MASLENSYTKKLSLLRIVTNSTPSVVAIIIFIVFLIPFFNYRMYTNWFYLFSSIVIEVGIIVFITILCYKEYKNSYFYIDDQKIVFHRFYQPNKLDTILLKDIKEVEIKNCNCIVKNNKGQKLVLEYINKPKEIKEYIEKKLKKHSGQ